MDHCTTNGQGQGRETDVLAAEVPDHAYPQVRAILEAAVARPVFRHAADCLVETADYRVAAYVRVFTRHRTRRTVADGARQAAHHLIERMDIDDVFAMVPVLKRAGETAGAVPRILKAYWIAQRYGDTVTGELHDDLDELMGEGPAKGGVV